MDGDSAAVLVFVVAGVVVGAVAATRDSLERFFGAPGRRARRALERRRAVPLSNARDGTCEKVVGTVVVAGDTLVAPLSGRRCVACEIVIEENVPRGWDVIRREIQAVDFLLQDGDVTARVAMGCSELALVLDYQIGPRAGEVPPPALTTFVATRIPSAVSRPVRLRAREGVLQAGERASVYGMLGTEPVADGAGGDYRMAPSHRVIGPPEGAEKVLVSCQRSTLRA